MRPRTSIACAGFFAAALLQAGQPVWLDVPYVRQQAEGCGSASLAMTMLYWQARGALRESPPSAAVIQRELYRPAEHGIAAGDMQRYLARHGFQAFAFRGEWADLEHHLAAGRPLIVAFQAPGGTLHYAVAAGIGPDTVSLNDPADRKLRQYTRRDFERRWNATEHWTLLAVPLPASAPPRSE